MKQVTKDTEFIIGIDFGHGEHLHASMTLRKVANHKRI